MSFPALQIHHGAKTSIMVLFIVFLCVLDAFFTLELISRGARELNPLMDYYLKKGDMTFFVVKYLMTSACLFIVLAIKELSLFGNRISRRLLLLFFIGFMGAVVQWELYLLS
ncbi:MAG: DUF5658 family protein [Desulfatiglandales bacterium]